MKFTEIVKLINAKVLNQGRDFAELDVTNFVASDMMSEVLTTEKKNICLITSLSTPQVLRTLDHVGGAGCIIVNNSPVQKGVVELAGELGLTLLKTTKPAFEVCVAIGRALDG